MKKSAIYAALTLLAVLVSLPTWAQSLRSNKLLESPEGVTEQLTELFDKPAVFDARAFRGWEDQKRQWRDDYGLSAGVSSYLLTQKANVNGTAGDDDSLGGVYRFQGSWELLNRGKGNAGRIEWRYEYRTSHFGSRAPTELSGDLGITALDSGYIFSDNFDADLSVINWTQFLNDKSAGFAVGRLAFDVYQDAYLFQGVNSTFVNRAFIINPAIATTGIGALGAAFKSMMTEHFWIGGQIFDANAENGEWDWNTVEEKEWLKSVELGWTPNFDERKTQKIQLTYWRKDSREELEIDSGTGLALTAVGELSEDLVGFLRYGHSDGGAGVPARNAASIGFEYSPWVAVDWTGGIGFAEPSDNKLDNEYVLETAVRFQLTPQVSLMPDLQLMLDPAANEDENSLWIVSLKAVIAL